MGRLLFGSGARYQVGVWIATRDEDVLFPSMIFDETGVVYSTSLTNHLIYDHFVDLDMLAPVIFPNTSQRSAYYNRLDSPLWDIFRVASTALVRIDEAVTAGHMDAIKSKLLGLRDRVDAL